MSRPAFQFYTGDWQKNAKLRFCSHAARGAWIDVLCLMHNSEEYGVLRCPLKDIALAVGAPLKLLRELVEKGVLKGGDGGCPAYIYTPRHAGKDGVPVALVHATDRPCWYSSRLVRDEHIRKRRGYETRFDSENNPQSSKPKPRPTPPPKEGIGEGIVNGSSASTSSSSSTSSTAIAVERRVSSSPESLQIAEESSENSHDKLDASRRFEMHAEWVVPENFQSLISGITPGGPPSEDELNRFRCYHAGRGTFTTSQWVNKLIADLKFWRAKPHRTGARSTPTQARGANNGLPSVEFL